MADCTYVHLWLEYNTWATVCGYVLNPAFECEKSEAVHVCTVYTNRPVGQLFIDQLLCIAIFRFGLFVQSMTLHSNKQQTMYTLYSYTYIPTRTHVSSMLCE